MFKHTVIIVTFSLFSSLLFGQEEKKSFFKKLDDQLVVDICYENFIGKPNNVNFKWFNNGFNAYYMVNLPFGKSPLSVATGIGISTQSYYSNAQLRTTTDTVQQLELAEWQNVAQGVDYRNNKIATTYFEIPIEFRWKSKPSSSGARWQVAVGGKIAYLFDTHDKLVLRNRDKYKTYIFPHMNPIRAGVHTRIGYGKVHLTAYYGVTPWLNDGRGPQMNQFSVGVSIIPF